MEVTEPKRPYADNNLFTYEEEWRNGEHFVKRLETVGSPNGHAQFDLAIIEVDEEGDFVYPEQLENIGDRIRSYGSIAEPS